MDVAPKEMPCDGCGRLAAPEHIARRLRRLELASRFRPLHIGILFLAEAPPSRIEDYFYYSAEDVAQSTGLSRVLFDSLLQGVGIAPHGGATRRVSASSKSAGSSWPTL